MISLQLLINVTVECLMTLLTSRQWTVHFRCVNIEVVWCTLNECMISTVRRHYAIAIIDKFSVHVLAEDLIENGRLF